MESFCRICRINSLEILFDLGDLKYTGFFPRSNEIEKSAPIRLSICRKCNLVQLYDQNDPKEFYKDGYGYESNLNSQMRQHLVSTAEDLESFYTKVSGVPNTVLDIASNDGTLLSGYKNELITKIGIDPLIDFVNDKYPNKSIKISKFFSADEVVKVSTSPIDIVTSLSVFYDLNDPVSFAKDIYKLMSDNAIWFLEQSYLPSMIETNSYDTICHEHLNYYTLSILDNIMKRSGLKIINVKKNKVNGGSIAVMVVKDSNFNYEISLNVRDFKNFESNNGYLTSEPLLQFVKRSKLHMQEFKKCLISLKSTGNEIYGLGASTKGNVMLQAAGIGTDLITSIGEINPRKFGKFTPGTRIPIVNESEILSANPKGKVVVIIPWHFEDSILRSLKDFINNGGQVLVPLPKIHLIKK